MRWTKLEGKALEKFQTVFTEVGAEVVFASEKIRNKTVFARDSGVVRFYVAGDNGYAYTQKECISIYGIDQWKQSDFEQLVRAASGLEYDPKAGVYKNFKLGAWTDEKLL